MSYYSPFGLHVSSGRHVPGSFRYKVKHFVDLLWKTSPRIPGADTLLGPDISKRSIIYRPIVSLQTSGQVFSSNGQGLKWNTSTLPWTK